MNGPKSVESVRRENERESLQKMEEADQWERKAEKTSSNREQAKAAENTQNLRVDALDQILRDYVERVLGRKLGKGETTEKVVEHVIRATGGIRHDRELEKARQALEEGRAEQHRGVDVETDTGREIVLDSARKVGNAARRAHDIFPARDTGHDRRLSSGRARQREERARRRRKPHRDGR